MESIQWVLNKMPKSGDEFLRVMSPANVEKARAFHQSFPQYAVTPLADLTHLAGALGLGGVYVKDESYRFGLNAFKVLGGSFAMARYVAQQLDRDAAQVDYAYLTGEDLKREFGQATFFTATDGNHGRGVAWAARQLGQKAVVHMPSGTVKSRFDNIAREGARVTIEDMNYDDCVRLAAKEAVATPRGVVVQDTAWEGYRQIPSWIMQGYGTMAAESAQQMALPPTHIFVQAGVGSLAGAVVGYFAGLYPDNPPVMAVVEASAADCLYRSAAAGDGSPRAVGGALNTIMAGLACGEANPIAWDILRNHARAFISCPDWVCAKGMRMLGAPMRGDMRVISGESGAVCAGLLAAIMEMEDSAELRKALGLGADSRVLLFSTEGDTDPENYRDIVWDGAHPSPQGGEKI